MEFLNWLIGGGVVALAGTVIAYSSYMNKLKEQVEKDATEKARLNESLKHIHNEMKRITTSYDKGIVDFYKLQNDITILEHTIANLINRYNREHSSRDIKNIHEVKNDRK